MEKRERQLIPGLGTLLVVTLIFGLIGTILRDFKGVGFGVVGGLIWAGAVVVTFVLATATISRRVLPLQNNLGWSEGFRLLWRNYTIGAANLLYGRRREVINTTGVKKKKSASAELSPSFKLLGAGFLFSHEAAAITRGNSYSRADGPGLVFLHGGENIAKVFDLRPQSRKTTVTAVTRDGIPVETSVSVMFRVRPPSPHQRRPRSVEADVIPYPYDRDALFELLFASSVADDETRDWSEQVCPQAATLLVTEIGKFTLDELLESAASEPLGRIKDNIKRGLQEQQEEGQLQSLSKGIQIMNVSVGPLELPEAVTEKRLATWQVDWRNRVDQELVSGDIEAQRLYQRARARAQVENIEKLLLSIDAMRRQSQEAELYEVVMRRLIEVLEAMSASRSLGPLSSRAAIRSLVAEATGPMRRTLAGNEE